MVHDASLVQSMQANNFKDLTTMDNFYRYFKKAIIRKLYRLYNSTRNNLFYPFYGSICINKLETPQQIILLLSHMRAGSTLCVNLLCTNPEIIGIGESGITYSSANDFRILRGKVYRRRSRLSITEKYLLDNLNQNLYIPNVEILLNNHVKCIFLLRESESALSSLLNEKFIQMEARSLNIDPKQIDWKKWFSAYYNKRLSKLMEYAKIINNKEKSLYFTYEQLIFDTKTIFDTLKSFLGVQGSFSEEYTPLPSRGTFGGIIGDPVSKKITSGKVIKDSSPKILLPPEISQQCWETYQNANTTLSKYCRCIDES
jgi:hypothetical protein